MKEDLINRQYLVHSLNITSSYFNVSHNIIDYYCLDKIYNLSEKYNGPTNELKELIESHKNISLETKFSTKIFNFLDPLLNSYPKEEDEELEDREEEIKYAIWGLLPTSPNPVYQELKIHFPRLKTINRLFYLQIVHRLIDRGEKPLSGHHPLGMNEYFQIIKTNYLGEKAILSVGNIWHAKKIDSYLKVKSPDKIKVEKFFMDTILKKLIFFNEQDVYMGWQQKSYLMSQLDAYMLKSKEEINIILNSSKLLCRYLYELQSNYPEEINKLEVFEWKAITKLILFTLTEEFIFYINTFRPKTNFFLKKIFQRRKKDFLEIRCPLARRDTKDNILIIKVFDGEVKFELLCDNSEYSERLNISDDKNFEKNLNDLYSKYIKQVNLALADKDNIFFHKLRYDIQNLEFDNIIYRIKDITRKANQLVFAHKISYYAYDATNDTLEPLVLKRDKNLRNKDIKSERKLREQAYKHAKAILSKWGEDNTLRKQSALYKCLDGDEVVSRFFYEDNCILEDSSRISGLPYESFPSVINGKQIENDWFKDEKDVLILPVMFHGRKQGVLYLATVNKNQFLYLDRLRLMNFIQIFEAELFEARLMDFLNKISTKLGKAINNEIQEKDFFDFISGKLSELLGATGVMMWWNTEKYNDTMEILGKSGKNLNRVFGDESYLNKNDVFFEKIISTNENIIHVINKKDGGGYGEILNNIGYKHSTYLPIKDKDNKLLGALIILDKNVPNSISKAFEEEVFFLSREIQEIIMHLFIVKGKINVIRTLLGHDVNSAFRTIDGIRKRLSAYTRDLPNNKIRDYRKKLKDIDKAVMTGKSMLDFITNEDTQESLKYSNAAPVLTYLNYLNENQKMDKTVTIKQTIQSVLHSALPSLRKNGIDFVFDEDNVGLELWINERLLHEVFSNMVDNIAKYGKPYSVFFANIAKTNSDYRIVIESRGIILSDSTVNNFELLFEDGVRCLPEDRYDKYHDGKGIGLYISREICRSWGGDLEIEYKRLDQDWANYKFSITFPLWLSLKNNPWLE